MEKVQTYFFVDLVKFVFRKINANGYTKDFCQYLLAKDPPTIFIIQQLGEQNQYNTLFLI